MKLVSAFLLVTVVSATSVCSEVVLRGIPSQRIEVVGSSVSSNSLPTADAIAATVAIDRQGDRYFWSSRNGIELVRRVSGIYTIFIAQSGAGYIKVERPLYDGEPFHFLEHVHLGLGTITYFGETQAFKD